MMMDLPSSEESSSSLLFSVPQTLGPTPPAIQRSSAATVSSNELTTDFEVSYDHVASQAPAAGFAVNQSDPAVAAAAAAAYAMPGRQELPGNRLASSSGSSGGGVSNAAVSNGSVRPCQILPATSANHQNLLGENKDPSDDEDVGIIESPSQSDIRLSQSLQLMQQAPTNAASATKTSNSKTKSSLIHVSETSSDGDFQHRNALIVGSDPPTVLDSNDESSGRRQSDSRSQLLPPPPPPPPPSSGGSKKRTNRNHNNGSSTDTALSDQSYVKNSRKRQKQQDTAAAAPQQQQQPPRPSTSSTASSSSLFSSISAAGGPGHLHQPSEAFLWRSGTLAPGQYNCVMLMFPQALAREAIPRLKAAIDGWLGQQGVSAADLGLQNPVPMDVGYDGDNSSNSASCQATSNAASASAASAAASAVRRSDVANFGEAASAPTQMVSSSQTSTAAGGFVPRMAIAHGATVPSSVSAAAPVATPTAPVLSSVVEGTKDSHPVVDDGSGRLVYALWRPDGFYYAGRIVSREPPDVEPVEPFRVHFDDGNVAPSVKFNQIVWLASLPVGTKVCADPNGVGSYSAGYVIVEHLREMSAKSAAYRVRHEVTGCTLELARGGVALTKELAKHLLASSTSNLSPTIAGVDLSVLSSDSSNISASGALTPRSRRLRRERVLRDSWMPEPPADVCPPERPGSARKGSASKRGRGGATSRTLAASPKPRPVALAATPKPSSAATPRGVSRKAPSAGNDDAEPNPSSLPVSPPRRQSPRRHRHQLQLNDASSSFNSGGPMPTDSTLFLGYRYLISNTPCQIDENRLPADLVARQRRAQELFDYDWLERQLDTGGATRLELENLSDNLTAQQQQRLVLLSPTFSRSVKFLTCLAARVPCLSTLWVADSCSRGCLQPIEAYRHVRGWDPVNDRLVPWSATSPNVFGNADQLILVVSDSAEFLSQSGQLLEFAGARVKRLLPWQLTADLDDDIVSIEGSLAWLDEQSCPMSVPRRLAQLGCRPMPRDYIVACVVCGRQLEIAG